MFVDGGCLKFFGCDGAVVGGAARWDGYGNVFDFCCGLFVVV